MKTFSPRAQATIIAMLFALVFGGVLYLLIKYHPEPFTLYIGISSFVFFLFAFFIVLRTLNNFLFEKIQPIYKTIHDFNLSQKDLKKQILQKDLPIRLHKEVEDWAEKKTKEIKKLKQLEKYRKDFLGNVMHELKTPIFNIQGYILTLIDGGIDDPSINKLYLERTEKSINRMITIVEDLESISRLESGELKLNIEEFDIVKLTEEIFESMDLKAKQKNIRLSMSYSSTKGVKVQGDRRRIQDVLNNLIINSINYGVRNGNTTVTFMEMGQNILIDVTDNGLGIGEKDLPRIFERFYRTDKSRSRDQGGSGLGLAIVKHIIEAHNQTINVKSRIDKGSSFIFTLKKA